MESSRAAVEVRKLQYMDERQTCAGTSTPWPYSASRAGPEMRVADAPMGTPKNKTPLGRSGVLSRDAMIALNWFMRSRIGNDAVALTLEGHRRPRSVLGVRRQPLVQEQLRDRQS